MMVQVPEEQYWETVCPFCTNGGQGEEEEHCAPQVQVGSDVQDDFRHTLGGLPPVATQVYPDRQSESKVQAPLQAAGLLHVPETQVCPAEQEDLQVLEEVSRYWHFEEEQEGGGGGGGELHVGEEGLDGLRQTLFVQYPL